MKKIFKNIAIVIAVIIGLAVVFYGGMTFNQTLFIDWCIDDGWVIKQWIHDYCVFPETKLEIK